MTGILNSTEQKTWPVYSLGKKKGIRPCRLTWIGWQGGRDVLVAEVAVAAAVERGPVVHALGPLVLTQQRRPVVDAAAGQRVPQVLRVADVGRVARVLAFVPTLLRRALAQDHACTSYIYTQR